MTAPTIFDVARHAGVSKSTVSKVLTHAPHVSSQARARVLAAIAALNYHPNVAARRLQSRTSHLIGLAFARIGEPSMTPAFFTAFMNGAAAVAGPQGYDLVWLVSIASGASAPEAFASTYLRREVDGLLVANMATRDARVDALKRVGCPFVVVGRYDDPDVYAVDVDNVAVGALATKQVLTLGHRRVGLLNGPASLPFCQDRLRGYQEALGEYRVPFDPALVSADAFLEARGFDATLRLLGLARPPTALVVTDQVLRAGCLRALAERRLAVPEHLSLVGVDDYPPEGGPSSFSAVIQPSVALAEAATALLLQLMRGQRPRAVQQRLRPTVAAGQSMAPPPR